MGTIYPHSLDGFDVNDKVCGPSMYTVVEQYIKPLTMRAGNMSWALLRNPEGRQCDFFVSHSWAEGAYELLDQVLASWPYGNSSVWVCSLAVPQNLDLGFMLRSPMKTPFAIALRESKMVIVASTKKVHIYQRIWCVYEAYLAMIWGKTVYFATSRASKCENFTTVILIFLLPVPLWKWDVSPDRQDVLLPSDAMLGILLVIALLVTNMLDVCKVRNSVGELGVHFSTVRDAQASIDNDRDRILDDIKNHTEDVDDMLRLLLRIGLFSPRLLEASRRGVNFRGLATPNFPRSGTLLWLYSISVSWGSTITDQREDYDESALLWLAERAHTVSFAMLSLICFLYCIQDMDGRALIRAVVQKNGVLMLVSMFFGIIFKKAFIACYLASGLSIIAAGVCCAGVAGVSRIPLVGKLLVEIFGPGAWTDWIVRRCSCLFRQGWRQNEPQYSLQPDCNPNPGELISGGWIELGYSSLPPRLYSGSSLTLSTEKSDCDKVMACPSLLPE